MHKIVNLLNGIFTLEKIMMKLNHFDNLVFAWYNLKDIMNKKKENLNFREKNDPVWAHMNHSSEVPWAEQAIIIDTTQRSEFMNCEYAVRHPNLPE